MPLIRLATPEDIPALTALIDLSVRKLQAVDYSPAQIDASLRTVYGVDTQLVHDGTYFAVEEDATIVACGGWSKRRTLYGGDQAIERDDAMLDPASEAARIRAFFVHPGWIRRGIGTLILKHCEAAAIAEGFQSLEMGATLTGVPLYEAHGYVAIRRIDVPIGDSLTLPVIHMAKRLDGNPL